MKNKNRLIFILSWSYNNFIERIHILLINRYTLELTNYDATTITNKYFNYIIIYDYLVLHIIQTQKSVG